ncbi:MAG TPA: hypothetical protein DDW50_16180 [Firmicutes bacterium]|jgi:two-component system, sensor histidine kinase YesM|nr:hypothetical protein [Bacillota bacterium]
MLLDWFRNLKLKNKIALTCMTLIALSLLISAVFLYSYVAVEIRQNAYVSSADLLTQVSNFLDEKLKGIIRRVYGLELNQDFNETLSTFLFNEEKYRYALALSNFSNSFSEIRSTETFTSSVFMNTPKGEFFDFSKIKNPDFNFKISRLYQELYFRPGQTVYWGLSQKDEIYRDAKQVVPLVFQFTIDGYNSDLYIVVNLDKQAISEYLGKIYSGAGNWILILDSRGHEVVTTHDQTTRLFLKDNTAIRQIAHGVQGRIMRRYKGVNYSISYQRMTVAPWKIVNIKSERVLLHKLNELGIFVLILTGACMMATLVLAVILSNTITHPLVLLEETIQRVTQRDLNVKFEYSYHDEVGRLGNSFNFMVEEIRQLIDKLHQSIIGLQEEKEKVKIEQQLKRQAELKALQAQINPHFLYNTLDSIHWMADQIQAKDISRMTMALGTLFRTGLNKGQDIITIKNELENVTSYLTIQKMRYGEQFSYAIDIDREIQDLLTIKLILQPLVENAIYHGIKEKSGSGSIIITGGMADNGRDIRLTVRDNGAGIHPVALNLINRRLDEEIPGEKPQTEGKGYGIYNVNERIKLYFGPDYGLHFKSEWGQGTEAGILIPAVAQGENAKNVQNLGSG